MAILKLLSSHCLFEGLQQRYRHYSRTLGCEMNFSIYLPPTAFNPSRAPRMDGPGKFPAIYWLSGLTCTDENFTLKAGAQRTAAELGIVLVIPDTSPRGEGVAASPDAAYDLGLGAGFYVNATQAPWSRNYQMYDYIVDELPALIEQNFAVGDVRAISGHSMGGHGALVIALRNPRRYSSVSAFSPIANPIASSWGRKAFTHYLGNDEKCWQNYDATLLIESSRPSEHLPLLVDQGDADEFLPGQLKIERLIAACEAANYGARITMRQGYDHSYFFISTFIENHLRFHHNAFRNF
ncbi:MAG: S-formylglutathione hydrolase [Nitrosospira sp. 56-18]|nr:MAG: S-formylglutathione hydrolase [Nitrosospira sp. 56-18]